MQSVWPFPAAMCSGVPPNCAHARQAPAPPSPPAGAPSCTQPCPRHAPAAGARSRCGPPGQPSAAVYSHPARPPVRPQPRRARPLAHHRTRSHVRAALQQQAHAIDVTVLGSQMQKCYAILSGRHQATAPAEPARWRTQAHLHTRSCICTALKQQAHAVGVAFQGCDVQRCKTILRAHPSGHSPAEPARWRTFVHAAVSAPRSSSRRTQSVWPSRAA